VGQGAPPGGRVHPHNSPDATFVGAAQ